MAILVLQLSVRGQNRSKFHPENSCDDTKVKNAKIDASKLKKYPFQVQKVSKNIFSAIIGGFDSTSQYQYGMGVNNMLTFCFCLFLILFMAQGRCALRVD